MRPYHLTVLGIDLRVIFLERAFLDFNGASAGLNHLADSLHDVMNLALGVKDGTAAVCEIGVGSIDHEEIGEAGNGNAEVGTRVVFGTVAAVLSALGMSRVSRAINTAFVERENGTDRHRNARKARKTYRFSKDWQAHEAVTYLTLYSYNFCWPVRTLTDRGEQGHRRERSPAMAAGLADHVWSMAEWLSRPAVQRY